jgi:hypothetical protein
MTKVAVLINVFLERMEEFKTQIDNLFDKDIEFDIFIYTYKRYAKYVSWFPNVKSVKYVEDDINAMKQQDNIRKISKVSSPSNIFQYFNLKRCFDMMETYRIINNISYDYVYKIRTLSETSQFLKSDLTKRFWLPDKIDDNTLYSKSDQFYVGSFNSMKKVSLMCDHIFSMYFGINTNHEYWPLNFNTIMESDMDSVRFDMLVYPDIISQKALNDFSDSGPHQKDPLIIKETLKNEIREKITQLNEYKHKKGNKVVTGPGGMKKRTFRAEKSFAHYVSSICNLVVKELPDIRKGG